MPVLGAPERRATLRLMGAFRLADAPSEAGDWRRGTTDAVDGCVHWEEEVEYAYAARGKYLAKSIIVASEHPHTASDPTRLPRQLGAPVNNSIGGFR